MNRYEVIDQTDGSVIDHIDAPTIDEAFDRADTRYPHVAVAVREMATGETREVA